MRQLVEEFALGFYGYGNLRTDLWFVGMEEGSSGELSDHTNRLRAWEDRGRRIVEGLRDYHQAINVMECFDASAKLQPTWRGLMRILFSAKGSDDDPKTLLTYQTTEWGSEAGDAALLELYPLAKPKRSDWKFDAWYPRVPWLGSDKEYRKHLRSARVERIASLIAEYRPKNVVFYGTEHRVAFAQIVGANAFQHVFPQYQRVGVAYGEHTTAYLIPHPARLSNDLLRFVGRQIGALPADKSGSFVEARATEVGHRTMRKSSHGLAGRYNIVNRARLEHKSRQTDDPRAIFYEAILRYRSYEDYLAAVGSTVVQPATFKKPVTGYGEIRYCRDSGWIEDSD